MSTLRLPNTFDRFLEDGKEYPGRVWAGFFRELLALVLGGVVPLGGIVMMVLSADDIAAQFIASGTNAGLGLPSGRFSGWAICNGNNGTPSLDGKFPRFETSASGAVGAVALAGAGSYFELVPIQRLR
jgi:hypothetical protein